MRWRSIVVRMLASAGGNETVTIPSMQSLSMTLPSRVRGRRLLLVLMPTRLVATAKVVLIVCTVWVKQNRATTTLPRSSSSRCMATLLLLQRRLHRRQHLPRMRMLTLMMEHHSSTLFGSERKAGNSAITRKSLVSTSTTLRLDESMYHCVYVCMF